MKISGMTDMKQGPVDDDVFGLTADQLQELHHLAIMVPNEGHQYEQKHRPDVAYDDCPNLACRMSRIIRGR